MTAVENTTHRRERPIIPRVPACLEVGERDHVNSCVDECIDASSEAGHLGLDLGVSESMRGQLLADELKHLQESVEDVRGGLDFRIEERGVTVVACRGCGKLTVVQSTLDIGRFMSTFDGTNGHMR
jgi:hypothetical protein